MSGIDIDRIFDRCVKPSSRHVANLRSDFYRSADAKISVIEDRDILTVIDQDFPNSDDVCLDGSVTVQDLAFIIASALWIIQQKSACLPTVLRTVQYVPTVSNSRSLDVAKQRVSPSYGK